MNAEVGAAGLGAGYSAGSNLASRGIDFEKKNREIYKEGALGTDEYNIRSSAKELTNNNDFNRACKYLEIESPEQKEELIKNNNLEKYLSQKLECDKYKIVKNIDKLSSGSI